MAERVVIAELDFGDAGVKGVLGDTNAGLVRLEGQTTRTANVFAARMFNMRTAAMAFLGSFTLAGLIFGLKNFMEHLIRSAGAFALFSEQAEKVSNRFSAWLVDILQINPALNEMTQWMDRLMVLADRMDTSGIASGVGVVTRFLFGLTPVSKALEILRLSGELFDQATGRKDVASFIGPPAPPGIGNQSRYTPALDELIKKQNIAHMQQRLLMEGYHDLGGDIEGAFNQGDAAIEELNFDISVLVEPSRWQKFKLVIKDLAKEFQVAATIIQTAVDALSSGMTEWAEGGTLTMRKFFSEMLIMLAQSLLAWGALAIIRGYFTGDATLIAAGLVAVGAGIAAFVAARAIGGGGDRAVSAGQAGAAAAGGGGGTWNYNVTFTGPTFGFNEAMFARYIAEVQRRGERGGG